MSSIISESINLNSIKKGYTRNFGHQKQLFKEKNDDATKKQKKIIFYFEYFAFKIPLQFLLFMFNLLFTANKNWILKEFKFVYITIFIFRYRFRYRFWYRYAASFGIGSLFADTKIAYFGISQYVDFDCSLVIMANGISCLL